MNESTAPDLPRLRRYRLGWVQAEVARRGLAGVLLFDPVNLRYATDTTGYVLFNYHSPVRAALVPPTGGAVLFGRDEGPAAQAGPPDIVAEVRAMPAFNHFYAGPRAAEQAARLAADLAAVVARLGDAGRPLAVDRLDPVLAAALADAGLALAGGQETMEHARAIKSADEVACMKAAIAVAEAGLGRIRDALEPGVTEAELCALLAHDNVAGGSEWLEYRLVCAGPRANPWGQEASDRLVRAGELLIVDTGMIGPYNYFADLSRTFLCGPAAPTAEQKRLYRLARDNIRHNIGLLRPGLTFREFADRAWPLPPDCAGDRYPTPLHGVGMRGEHPMIRYPQDWDAEGYDGVIETNMTLSVESYIGVVGGGEGAKLEEQVLITADGVEMLSTFPLEDVLLA